MQNSSELCVRRFSVGMIVTRLYSIIHVSSAFGVVVGVSDVRTTLNDSILRTTVCGIIDPVVHILIDANKGRFVKPGYFTTPS